MLVPSPSGAPPEDFDESPVFGPQKKRAFRSARGTEDGAGLGGELDVRGLPEEEPLAND